MDILINTIYLLLICGIEVSLVTNDEIKIASELANEFGYKKYMITRYLRLWGLDETKRLLESNEHKVLPTIRYNSLKIDRETFENSLKARGIVIEQVKWLPDAYFVKESKVPIGATIEYLLGWYYVQAIPSIAAAYALQPAEGDLVYDIAAAPGGKTTYLAQMMNNTGMIIAMDPDRLRLRALKSNISRCGVKNTIVLRYDGKNLQKLPFRPDMILLDAPCTGEGLIVKDPSRKTSKTQADIMYCSTIQKDLLDVALNVLKPGGELVYSTCSIGPEENEMVIDFVLQSHPDVEIVPLNINVGEPGIVKPFGVDLRDDLIHARRFYPHKHGTEGFFIIKLHKR